MTPNLSRRWKSQLSELGIAQTDDWIALGDQIGYAYACPSRVYHNQTHLLYMLDLLDVAPLKDRFTVMLAAWFHDAVYLPKAQDNESRSAQWASDALRSLGVEQEKIARVVELIMATETHDADEEDTDCQALLDADLAILGADWTAYEVYMDAIRKEYAWVPEPDYKLGRAKILRQFLHKERIFLAAQQAHRESVARENLQRELELLQN